MIAIEFIDEYNNNEFSNYVVELLRNMGILVLLCGNNGQYIRILPSLLIEEDHVMYFILVLKSILHKMDFYT